jgi:transcriptional regulator with XRE-family HTH domain
MKPHEINTDKLAVLLRERRGERGLREVAREIGDVSAPTLSRVEQGRLPDLDTFIKLCRWLGVSPESFIKEQLSKDATSQEASTSEKVEILLRGERTLQPDTINAIIKMVNLAIEASRKGSAESTNK